MQEKVKDFLSKGKQWWSGTAKKTKILLGAVLVVMLAAIVVIVAVSMNRPMSRCSPSSIRRTCPPS